MIKIVGVHFQFQSTPPSGERSDGHQVEPRCLRALFQSTPPSGERSDVAGSACSRCAVVSIHAPLRREERPWHRQ